MRTSLSALSLLRPKTLSEALQLLRDEESLTPLAGCTDVYVNLQFGTLKDTRFVDLWPLDQLRGISATKDVLRIGALTTYTQIIASPLVRRRLPMLVAAAKEIGGRQIQNRGTLGGNVANGSPAGDSLPVLAAADAQIVLTSTDGERRVTFRHFQTGYRTNVMRPDELITAIEFPSIQGRQWWRKVGTRRAQAISKVMMAGVRGRHESRLALGSVAPTILRLPRTEAALTAGASEDAIRQVLDSEIAPIDDMRSTAAYRRRVSGNLLNQFLTETA
jgi:xanthine dehydrogenase small subunit